MWLVVCPRSKNSKRGSKVYHENRGSRKEKPSAQELVIDLQAKLRGITTGFAQSDVGTKYRKLARRVGCMMLLVEY